MPSLYALLRLPALPPICLISESDTGMALPLRRFCRATGHERCVMGLVAVHGGRAEMWTTPAPAPAAHSSHMHGIIHSRSSHSSRYPIAQVPFHRQPAQLLPHAHLHGGGKHHAADVEVEAQPHCVTGHQYAVAAVRVVEQLSLALARLWGQCTVHDAHLRTQATVGACCQGAAMAAGGLWDDGGLLLQLLQP
jgi:hypothetical protein